MSLPTPNYEHLQRLSDDTGLLEHARGSVPRRECGYCVDDVARGLVVLSRDPAPAPALVQLTDTYLAFVGHAQGAAGACRNRLGFDRRWEDTAGTGDWWGRALWGLGSVVAGSGPPRERDEALDRFHESARASSPWPRATAFAALGAAEIASVVPGSADAERLLVSALRLGRPRQHARWPWPEDRLSYANAAWAEALIAAGHVLGDQRALADGLALLGWLVELQTVGDHLSVVPAAGWRTGEPRPGFDQQPIEVAALADGCARAFSVTGDDAWRIVVARCVAWFEGANDSRSVVHDPISGGCHDGLERDGVNRNEGAESTLAWLMTLQLGHALGVAELATSVA